MHMELDHIAAGCHDIDTAIDTDTCHPGCNAVEKSLAIGGSNRHHSPFGPFNNYFMPFGTDRQRRQAGCVEARKIKGNNIRGCRLPFTPYHGCHVAVFSGKRGDVGECRGLQRLRIKPLAVAVDIISLEFQRKALRPGRDLGHIVNKQHKTVVRNASDCKILSPIREFGAETLPAIR